MKTSWNPYEDIELESQCSQQSLPSSPGADTAKVKASRPGFFRQNSGRSFKLLDMRRTNQQIHSTGSSRGVSSPPQLSPPSTPTGPEQASWLPGDSYGRTCRRIPTVCVCACFFFFFAAKSYHIHFEQSVSFINPGKLLSTYYLRLICMVSASFLLE
uniref:Uncharacterized protein n=1 Tax=Pundamilia nyererei TaxID=303518 RepID=A0A3B4FG59_9CICH